MPSRPKTILIIDDDPNDRLLIAECIREHAPDHLIQQVHNGADAIAYLKGEGEYADRRRYPYPVMVITDLKMPVVDGLAVLEHLQKNPFYAVIPTLVFSASDDPDDVKQAYALGANAYHLKPTDAASFREQLRLFCDYWKTSICPMADETGRHLPTSSRGKVGERYSAPAGRPVRKRDTSADFSAYFFAVPI